MLARLLASYDSFWARINRTKAGVYIRLVLNCIYFSLGVWFFHSAQIATSALPHPIYSKCRHPPYYFMYPFPKTSHSAQALARIYSSALADPCTLARFCLLPFLSRSSSSSSQSIFFAFVSLSYSFSPLFLPRSPLC